VQLLITYLNEIVLAIFFLSAAIQFSYWLLIYSRFILHWPKKVYHSRLPVSVIICARNEEDNLRRNLPLVLQQDYPAFEVVVVDDRSGDGTQDLLRELQKTYPHLRTSLIKEGKDFSRGKKLAITIGIKAAKYEWLLMTDADCRPESIHWLSRMQRNFDKDTGVVLGYGGYTRSKGLLNMIIRFDTLFIALQYFTFALAGWPYMGVGRNLAYRRSLFFDNRGFAGHSHIVSGDDDLFVNEVARKYNTRIEVSKESHTRSLPEGTLKNWYYQKKRHLLTAPRYRGSSMMLIGTENLSRMGFYISFVWLISSLSWPVIVCSIFFTRLLAQMLIIYYSGRHLNEKQLLLISPLLDLIMPVFNSVLLFINFVDHKRNRWT